MFFNKFILKNRLLRILLKSNLIKNCNIKIENSIAEFYYNINGFIDFRNKDILWVYPKRDFWGEKYDYEFIFKEKGNGGFINGKGLFVINNERITLKLRITISWTAIFIQFFIFLLLIFQLINSKTFEFCIYLLLISLSIFIDFGYYNKYNKRSNLVINNLKLSSLDKSQFNS